MSPSMNRSGPPRVTVVTLNWNGRDDTLGCLESLSSIVYPAFDVVAVDNASRDDSVAVIRANFPGVTVIENRDNEGFTGGCNVGIRWALERGADYVLLLNNDTVVAPDFLDQLVRAAEAHPEVGIAGPKIFNYDRPQQLWFAGTRTNYSFGRRLALGHRGWGEVDVGQYDTPTRVGFLSGCAMLVRRKVFTAVGTFDPAFFAYFEDADFCLRAAAAGFALLYVPQSRIWHKAATSAGDSSSYSPVTVYLGTRNRLLFMRKHGTWWGWFVFVPSFCATTARTLWRFRTRRRAGVAHVVWMGLRDFLRGKLGPGSVSNLAGRVAGGGLTDAH